MKRKSAAAQERSPSMINQGAKDLHEAFDEDTKFLKSYSESRLLQSQDALYNGVVLQQNQRSLSWWMLLMQVIQMLGSIAAIAAAIMLATGSYPATSRSDPSSSSSTATSPVKQLNQSALAVQVQTSFANNQICKYQAISYMRNAGRKLKACDRTLDPLVTGYFVDTWDASKNGCQVMLLEVRSSLNASAGIGDALVLLSDRLEDQFCGHESFKLVWNVVRGMVVGANHTYYAVPKQLAFMQGSETSCVAGYTDGYTYQSMLDMNNAFAASADCSNNWELRALAQASNGVNCYC